MRKIEIYLCASVNFKIAFFIVSLKLVRYSVCNGDGMYNFTSYGLGLTFLSRVLCGGLSPLKFPDLRSSTHARN